TARENPLIPWRHSLLRPRTGAPRKAQTREEKRRGVLCYLLVEASRGPMRCGCRSATHKFGNHLGTISAPIFAVSRCGSVVYQPLTTKWEPRIGRLPSDEATRP